MTFLGDSDKKTSVKACETLSGNLTFSGTDGMYIFFNTISGTF